MRIIAGKYKNKKIEFIKNKSTRPLKDNVKENIFNILYHSNNLNIEIKNSCVLDLYAGTGSFGLECISRGSAKVIFVENNKNTIKILQNNLKKIDIKNNSILINQNVFDYINHLNFKKINFKFDLIFLDPPYVDNKFNEIIKFLRTSEFVKKKHLVIIHRERKSKDDFNKLLSIIERRVYGRSEIFFTKIL